MGGMTSISKSTELPRNPKKERRRGERLVTCVAFHLALSKQAYSVCTQALRDVFFQRRGKRKGKRQDEESDMNPTSCSLFKEGGVRLCICLRRPLLHTSNVRWGGWAQKKRNKRSIAVVGCDEEEDEGSVALKQDKTNRSSATHVVSSLWCWNQIDKQRPALSRSPVTNSGSLSSADGSQMGKLSLSHFTQFTSRSLLLCGNLCLRRKASVAPGRSWPIIFANIGRKPISVLLWEEVDAYRR